MNDPVSGLVSPMLRLFRAGTVPYQPEMDGLALETGDPQVSLENLQRLMGAGLGIVDFLVRPTGVLAALSRRRAILRPRPPRRNQGFGDQGPRLHGREGGIWPRGVPSRHLPHAARELHGAIGQPQPEGADPSESVAPLRTPPPLPPLDSRRWDEQ